MLPPGLGGQGQEALWPVSVGEEVWELLYRIKSLALLLGVYSRDPEQRFQTFLTWECVV